MKIALIEKGIAPFGVPCVICNHTAKAGQWVMYYTIPNVQHVLMHKGCVEEKLEEVPNDIDKDIVGVYNSIRSDYIEGKVFDE